MIGAANRVLAVGESGVVAACEAAATGVVVPTARVVAVVAPGRGLRSGVVPADGSVATDKAYAAVRVAASGKATAIGVVVAAARAAAVVASGMDLGSGVVAACKLAF